MKIPKFLKPNKYKIFVAILLGITGLIFTWLSFYFKAPNEEVQSIANIIYVIGGIFMAVPIYLHMLITPKGLFTGTSYLITFGLFYLLWIYLLACVLVLIGTKFKK